MGRRTSTGTPRFASTVDPSTRAATFSALRPALDALAAAAGADPCLSTEARLVLRAVTRTGPEATLAVADLAARGSTPKTRIPAALNELAARNYLARLTEIAPHLAAALPATTPPRHTEDATIEHRRDGVTGGLPPEHPIRSWAMMRKTAATAALSLAALTGMAAPAAAAEPVVPTTTAITAQQIEEDNGGWGLWGLIGLLCLAGLLKRNKTEPTDRGAHTGSGRTGVGDPNRPATRTSVPQI